MAGTPLLEPLPYPDPQAMPAQVAPALPPMLPPVADELQGGPMPYPPPAWLGQPEPSPYQEAPPPAEAAPAGPDATRAPDAAAPPPEAPAAAQAGGQAMQALDQAHASGAPTQATEWGGHNAPEAPIQSTGDPVLDQFASSEHEHERALRLATQAEQEKNAYLAQEGARIAAEQDAARSKADAIQMQAFTEAKTKRAQLDQEAQDIANTRIDPNRADKARGTAGNLFLGLMAGLVGASRQGMATGKNSIVDFVNAEAERDMQAQQADVNTRLGALQQRRGILGEQEDADQKRLDFSYKSINAHYETAKNYITSIAMQYDNKALTAKAMDQIQSLKDEQLKLGMGYEQQTRANAIAKSQNALGWYNAQTARMGEEGQTEARRLAATKENTEAEREKRNAATEYRGREIRGNDGRTVGLAKTEKEQEQANTVITNNANLQKLYEDGKQLFKDGYAMPAGERRLRQQTWAKNWAEARRHAAGDNSAPNQNDQTNWGVEADRFFGSNETIIDQAFKNARETSIAVLKHSGVPDEELKREGLIDPPEAPTPGVTDTAYFQDESGNINTEGRGRPLSNEETRAEEKRRGDFERTHTKLPRDTWMYQRDQNNIHASSKRKGPLPFPEVGTGPIE